VRHVWELKVLARTAPDTVPRGACSNVVERLACCHWEYVDGTWKAGRESPELHDLSEGDPSSGRIETALSTGCWEYPSG
jgi:hypothetical protein